MPDNTSIYRSPRGSKDVTTCFKFSRPFFLLSFCVLEIPITYYATNHACSLKGSHQRRCLSPKQMAQISWGKIVYNSCHKRRLNVHHNLPYSLLCRLWRQLIFQLVCWFPVVGSTHLGICCNLQHLVQSFHNKDLPTAFSGDQNHPSATVLPLIGQIFHAGRAQACACPSGHIPYHHWWHTKGYVVISKSLRLSQRAVRKETKPFV